MKLSNYIDSVSMEIDEIDYGTTEPNENFQDIVISHKSVVRKISKNYTLTDLYKMSNFDTTYPMDLSCRKTFLKDKAILKESIN